jgi:ATP-dependent exoDNAse (exonuclease V) beta subunit
MPDRAPLLWCKTDIEPFNEIGLLPIRFKGDVGKSIFYNEYATEIFNSYIDNINLMYVTFTRAKVSLWIWAESEDNKLIATGDLLRMSIQNASRNNFAGLNNDNAVSFNNHFNAEFKLLEIGSLTNYTEKLNIVENQSKDVEISEFRFTDFRKFLKIRTQSTDFFRKEGHRQVSINKGKLIHEILSYIDITQDLDKAIKKLEIEGKLNRSETGKIKSELGEMLNSEDVRSWFDGTYRVVNERNILIGGAVIKRPDRIMIGKDEVVVVDYKSGDAELDKYTYQLRSYIRELKSCGYAIVRGYIWYTKKNKRVEIQLN